MQVDRVLVVTSESRVAIQCHAALRLGELREKPYTVTTSFEPAAVGPDERSMVILDEESLPKKIGYAGLRAPNCLFVILSGKVTPSLVAAALASGARGVLSKSLPVEDAAATLDEIARGSCACRFNVPPECDAADSGGDCYLCAPLDEGAGIQVEELQNGTTDACTFETTGDLPDLAFAAGPARAMETHREHQRLRRVAGMER